MIKMYKYFIIKKHLIKFNFKFQHSEILKRFNRRFNLQNKDMEEIGRLWINNKEIIQKDNYLKERMV